MPDVEVDVARRVDEHAVAAARDVERHRGVRAPGHAAPVVDVQPQGGARPPQRLEVDAEAVDLLVRREREAQRRPCRRATRAHGFAGLERKRTLAAAAASASPLRRLAGGAEQRQLLGLADACFADAGSDLGPLRRRRARGCTAAPSRVAAAHRRAATPTPAADARWRMPSSSGPRSWTASPSISTTTTVAIGSRIGRSITSCGRPLLELDLDRLGVGQPVGALDGVLHRRQLERHARLLEEREVELAGLRGHAPLVAREEQRVAAQVLGPFRAGLAELVAPGRRPCAVDRLAVQLQPAPDRPQHVLARLRMTPSAIGPTFSR